MCVGVLRWVSNELLSLHKRDECGAELEVVTGLTIEDVIPDACGRT